MESTFVQLTTRDLSAALDISEETIIKLAKTGQLPYVQLNCRIYFIYEEIIRHFTELERGTA